MTWWICKWIGIVLNAHVFCSFDVVDCHDSFCTISGKKFPPFCWNKCTWYHWNAGMVWYVCDIVLYGIVWYGAFDMIRLCGMYLVRAGVYGMVCVQYGMVFVVWCSCLITLFYMQTTWYLLYPLHLLCNPIQISWGRPEGSCKYSQCCLLSISFAKLLPIGDVGVARSI